MTKFFVCHLTAAEDNHDLDAVAVFKKTLDFADFDIKVVVADFEANFHRFKLGLFFTGFFAIFGFFFHLLVLVFTPVDDFDNWWVGIGCNFNQVDTLFFSDHLRVAARHDAELLSISSNYADRRVADFSVKFSACIFTNGWLPFSLLNFLYYSKFLSDLQGFSLVLGGLSAGVEVRRDD